MYSLCTPLQRALCNIYPAYASGFNCILLNALYNKDLYVTAHNIGSQNPISPLPPNYNLLQISVNIFLILHIIIYSY